MSVVRRVDGTAPDPERVAEAAAALIAGALLIYPTETLYALGGIATAEVAARVRLAKGRDKANPLPLVAADLAQARELCEDWPAAAELLAARFWPGPLTLVLRARPGLPEGITAGSRTLAVRVPGLALPRELCRLAGALISTSANLSGDSPHSRCAPAVAAVGAHAALALDSGELGGLASAIVDLSGQPTLLREGAVATDAIAGALHEMGARLQTGWRKRDKPPSARPFKT